jgi:two-component system, OmpR family, KDP operon response regulator KdpE
MPEKLSPAPKVLIVSNQQTTGPLWVFSLQQQKMNVVLESDPQRAIQRCETDAPDLIVLDISLADEGTLPLLKALRTEVVSPIILLTPARTEDRLVEAYDAGVDDCMLKPVSPSIFQAKIKVWLRRSWSVSMNTLDPMKVGKLQLFPAERLILMENGQAVRLTNLELRLMYYLMIRADHTVSIEELNQRVWGYAAEADNTMLKNVVYRLRRKIESDPSDPQFVQTVVGAGYRLASGNAQTTKAEDEA